MKVDLCSFKDFSNNLCLLLSVVLDCKILHRVSKRVSCFHSKNFLPNEKVESNCSSANWWYWPKSAINREGLMNARKINLSKIEDCLVDVCFSRPKRENLWKCMRLHFLKLIKSINGCVRNDEACCITRNRFFLAVIETVMKLTSGKVHV